MDSIDYTSSNRKNISKYELRDFIDEISHQIVFLDKSQLELSSALEEDPNDIDFKQAYIENIQVIKRKKEIIIKLKDQLMELDIAYYLEYYKPQQGNINLNDSNHIIQVTDSNTISQIDTIQNTNRIHEISEGMYL